jgi:hypothetical protein
MYQGEALIKLIEFMLEKDTYPEEMAWRIEEFYRNIKDDETPKMALASARNIDFQAE